MSRDSRHWSRDVKGMLKQYMTSAEDMCYELPEGQSFVFGQDQQFTSAKMNAPKRITHSLDMLIIPGIVFEGSTDPDDMIIRKKDGTYQVWKEQGSYEKLSHAVNDILGINHYE